MRGIRVLVASVVLAVTLPGALLLHRHTVTGTSTPAQAAARITGYGSAYRSGGIIDPFAGNIFDRPPVRPSWDDPAALVVLVLGIELAIGLWRYKPRRYDFP